MTIYSHNNPAKEWILQDIAGRSLAGPTNVCDLACGSGSVWRHFLLDHPNVSYVGSDTDLIAVEKARRLFADVPNARFEIVDAQRPPAEQETYDIVTALSSLEHVVHIDKFLDTVFAVLKSGGVAYLNYDDGHFTSRDPKERLMVPVSQLLAKVGLEGPYMKRVADRDVIRWIEERGGKVLAVRKNNFSGLKGFAKQFAKGMMGEDVLHAWFDFENRLNNALTPSQLTPVMGATTIVMKKT